MSLFYYENDVQKYNIPNAVPKDNILNYVQKDKILAISLSVGVCGIYRSILADKM